MCTAHVKRILRIVLLLEKVKENFFFYFLMLILIAARSGASAASGGRVAALQLYSIAENVFRAAVICRSSTENSIALLQVDLSNMIRLNIY